MVTAESVGVNILGSHTGCHQGGVLRDGRLGDASCHGSEHPAGHAEEVEDVLQEYDEYHAGGALGKSGYRLHDNLHHGEYVDLQYVGKQVPHGQAQDNGNNIVKPVLDKIRKHAVLTEERELVHGFVHSRHQQTYHHGGEHAACAELGHSHQGAAFHGLEIHAHQESADSRKSGNHGPVFLADLVHTVVRDHIGHKQTDEAEGKGADGGDVRQRRYKPPQNRPQGRDGADHGKWHNIKDGVSHDAEPEILRNLVDDGNQIFLDPRLNLIHHIVFLLVS